ncbi:N(G),N(G)-dimethylarginine dimethylaminohydrolase 1 [Nematostella vectensis]|uniref:N(G),N(G)-dimethylarginine dimethylaminohydrolase 1 n=1 Tax=Nematostella vectensis TaxID=45351 RepID=UPI002076DFC2|nr:N(G),N(G)-dimethylarginine dimethylaminohydrolase 1 [Nematostella vectensis]
MPRKARSEPFSAFVRQQTQLNQNYSCTSYVFDHLKIMSTDFNYTRAIVSGVPSSLPANAQSMTKPSEPVNLEKARQQHSAYKATLKQLGLQVIEIPPNEDLPDCVFVEDAAVCVDNNALICNLGHESRRGEAAAMKEVLKKLGFDLVEMKEPARLDGGDVLFTGKEFFVGISKRSNKEGAETLAKAFPSLPVSTINVKGHLHLKSTMTMLAPDTIVTSDDETALAAWNELVSKAKYQYKRVVVPESFAANCLFINGTVVHRPEKEIPKSYPIYKGLKDPKVEMEISEFHKVDGCLTCRSILLK